ncbi:MAG: RsmD family RNA methyltransferase [Fibrobacteraceae bacterium]|nr:RsmD family RNA methyltransferase [Fibrobacteraceae bacterium]
MPIRITGGEFRGRLIASPLSSKTRPTAAMAREALFNILQDVSDFVVLDLFAGSGSVGIEAVSRGAASVFAVEKNPSQAKILADSYASLKVLQKLHLCVTDAEAFLKQALARTEKFDLIYADPPFTETYPDLRPFLDLLNEKGLAVFEVPSRAVPEWALKGRIRRYGESSLVFFSACL